MFLKLLLTVLLIELQQKGTEQASLITDPTYNAGVVEFQPSRIGTPKEQVKDNAKRFVEIIESNQARYLDIIVFPEYVLSHMDWKTFVPDPSLKIAPCVIPDYDHYLTQISCAARSSQIYVVINVLEKEHCAVPGYTDSCDPSGFNTYNTNVVFDRQGRVISRYRKSHLYRYEWHSTKIRSKPEVAIFETDFGVKFGHFICFDMLFYEPQQILVRDYNITDIIYPTFWFSELPFLTAIQLQEGYAYANDVNLLGADGSLPAEQNTGSGIYAGRLGRLQAEIFENPTTKLLTAKVPKRDRKIEVELKPEFVPPFVPQYEMPRFKKLKLRRDYNLDIFQTKPLDVGFTNLNETLCYDKFCCHFEVQRQTIFSSLNYDNYRYRLVAYDGSGATHQSMDPSELAICAIVACTGQELHTCGHIFPETTPVGYKYYFTKIQISGSFRKSTRRNILPSSVDGVMMPLPVRMFTWKEQEKQNVTDVTITLNSPKTDILTFGIWTNYYTTATAKHNLVPPNVVRSGGQTIIVSKFWVLLLFMALLWMIKRY